MTRFPVLTRRSFLGTLFSLGAILLLQPLICFLLRDRSRRPDLLSLELASFFHHKESARTIGLEYLRMMPNEADAGRLTRLICSRWQSSYDGMTVLDPANMKRLILRQQRDDFEKGRILNVRGWILSETEVRLCALAALV